MPDPRRDHDRLDAFWAYLQKPRTFNSIRDKFGVSPRTVHRWMDYLREDGADIVIRPGGGGRKMMKYQAQKIT